MDSDIDPQSPLFPIATAAELSGLHPQTLRQYDRLGLVQPQRTAGNTRRYSLRDIGRLREVQRLSSEGMGIEGIRRVLELEDENRSLRERVRQLETALANAALRESHSRVFAVGSRGATPIRVGTRPSGDSAVVLWRPRSH